MKRLFLLNKYSFVVSFQGNMLGVVSDIFHTSYNSQNGGRSIKFQRSYLAVWNLRFLSSSCRNKTPLLYHQFTES